MGGVCCAKEISPEDGNARIVSATYATSCVPNESCCTALDLIDSDWIVLKPGAQYKQKCVDIRQLALMRKPGEVVRGRRNGDWLVIADEGGFMPFVGTTTREPLFQRRSADGATSSTNSGFDEDTPASSSDDVQDSMKEAAEVVTNLHDAMCIKNLRDDLDGCSSGEQSPPSGPGAYIDLSYDSATWRVVYPMRFPVHSDMTPQAAFVGSRKPGDIIRGRRTGDFVAIAGEQGFIRIAAAITGKVVLQEIHEDTPTNALDMNHDWEAFEKQWAFPGEFDEHSGEVEQSCGEEHAITPDDGQTDNVQYEIENGSFTATIHTADPDVLTLGVKVSPVQVNGVDVGLVIKAIRPGLITWWNTQNPARQIHVGDIISDVNGSHAYSHDLFGMITQAMEAKDALHLIILRDRGQCKHVGQN